jgi:hypothetical protein
MSFFKSSFGSGKSFVVVPLLLIFLYPILVFFDIYLTYIGTPDLKLESNFVINVFSLGWFEIITFSIISVIIIILLTIKANKVFKHLLDLNEKVISLHYLLNFVIICIFFSHFNYSIFVIINNFLTVIYLKYDNSYWLKDISNQYVLCYNKDIAGFYFTAYLISIFVSIIVTFYRIKKAIFYSKKYQI